jgi:hypothetical protein
MQTFFGKISYFVQNFGGKSLRRYPRSTSFAGIGSNPPPHPQSAITTRVSTYLTYILLFLLSVKSIAEVRRGWRQNRRKSESLSILFLQNPFKEENTLMSSVYGLQMDRLLLCMSLQTKCMLP